MARYKAIDTSPKLLAEDLEKQLLPGGFEYAVHHLFDHQINFSALTPVTAMSRVAPTRTHTTDRERNIKADFSMQSFA